MDHYLLTARSVTRAQHMAQLLERAGIYVKVRRAGPDIAKNGCGYTLEIAERSFERARRRLLETRVMPGKVYFVSGGKRTEVSL